MKNAVIPINTANLSNLVAFNVSLGFNVDDITKDSNIIVSTPAIAIIK